MAPPTPAEADMARFKRDLTKLIAENFMPSFVKDDEHSRRLYLAEAMKNIKDGMWTRDERKFYRNHRKVQVLPMLYPDGSKRPKVEKAEAKLAELIAAGVEQDKVFCGMDKYLSHIFGTLVWEESPGACLEFVQKYCHLDL
jgi:hypothetical protein